MSDPKMACRADYPAKLSWIVRMATPEDAQDIIDMIKELAVYENMGDQAKLHADDLRESLSSEQPWLEAQVAVIVDPTCGEKDIVGYTIYFFRHDSLQGKSIVYMEDLYVRPALRGRGIGAALKRAVASHGLQKKCSELHFAVLAWNKTAIDFYKQLGARDRTEESSVKVYRLTTEDIERIATDPP